MPRLLDLFCGAGGAAAGYHRAGFSEVVGVDIHPQPNYPFGFIQADALEFLEGVKPGDFDLIHASLTCQHYSAGAKMRGTAGDHPDLLPETRRLLKRVGGD